MDDEMMNGLPNMTPSVFDSIKVIFGGWGFWVQIISAAIFVVIVMSMKKRKLDKPLQFLWKLPLLVAMFVAINVIMIALTMKLRILAGVGSWLAYALGVMIYSVLFCKYDYQARKVVASICISTIVIVNEVGGVFGMFMERSVEGFDNGYVKAAADVLLVGATWFLIKCPVWKYYVSPPAALLGQTSNILSTITVIIYDIFRVNLFGMNEDKYMQLLMSVIMLMLYVTNTVAYQMIYRLSQEQTHVLDLQASTQMDKSAASLLAVTENNLNELHKINHDIQNQYTYMRLLLKNGSYEELDKYFEELTGTFSEPLVPFVDCGNRVLDLIFNMENAKAKEAGVVLDIKAAPPHTLPFRDIDLCNLYANLIDNAIEACVAEKNIGQTVHVTVNVRGDYLFTQVVNPTKKDKRFLDRNPITTKDDRRLHGKGMSIVKGIIKRYNGRYAARIEDGMYYAEFFIDLTYKQEATNE